ncbi:UNVERIFIED_CONTAM: hypothetical protein Slati_3017400 [Sesamum latifolium]|uniref:DUF7036 domain-containing protein n=1 Tax=Sesamum latifolium TaxID=2727402 RepID=A0AAW2VKZ1_9LAMI
MGKGEDVETFPSTALDGQGTSPGAGNSNGCCLGCSRLKGLVTIVASFMLKKPAYFLKDYILQLEDDIFDEMSFSSTKVEIISLESTAGSNITKVVFAVESDVTTQSLIRASFVSLVTHQSFLHLTESLFGILFFEVLKFRGGITASPEQKAFLMQSVQILFNFTLNFSIDQIINNFDELRSQLKTGLHLAPYENLYIRLTNLKGSTIAPPTTVQSQVLLRVGINPSKSRLKQLAQTITGSHTKNLGLDNTVFGRVKQVSLSSILQHSLGSDGSSPSPSPSPSPMANSHHHHPAPIHHPDVSSLALHLHNILNGGSVTGKRSLPCLPLCLHRRLARIKQQSRPLVILVTIIGIRGSTISTLTQHPLHHPFMHRMLLHHSRSKQNTAHLKCHRFPQKVPCQM